MKSRARGRSGGVPESTKNTAAGFLQFQAYLAKSLLRVGDKLPPERELCGILGVTRTDLRKSLEIAEREGVISRHVGRGTFVGPSMSDELIKVSTIANVSTPSEVMRVRLIVEPGIAREACLHATTADFDELDLCLRMIAGVKTWRQGEILDNRFHRALAEATHNRLLLALFDSLNLVRRTVVWSATRDPRAFPPREKRFAHHLAIVAAVKRRIPQEAARIMRAHLQEVQKAMILDDYDDQ